MVVEGARGLRLLLECEPFLDAVVVRGLLDLPELLLVMVGDCGLDCACVADESP